MTAASVNGSAHALRVAEVQRTTDLIRQPDAVFEIRVLKARPVQGRPINAGGYFKDSALAARAALEQEARNPEGIYILLNEPDPLCYARSPERITGYLEPLTGNTDIIHRWWLLLDADPKRPSGVCATDEQVAAAEQYGAACNTLLREEYAWSDPVEAGSGNGMYLGYAVDLPNDPEAEQLLKAVVEVLNHRLKDVLPKGGPVVKIDSTVTSAARVIRLLGTWNGKGVSTADQPHRQSRLITVPSPLVRMALEQRKPWRPTPRRQKPGRPQTPSGPRGRAAATAGKVYF
jgi:hypothetical protein